MPTRITGSSRDLPQIIDQLQEQTLLLKELIDLVNQIRIRMGANNEKRTHL